MMKEPDSSSGFGGRKTGPLTCYHCGEIGHVRTRCPYREASRSTTTTQNCPQHPANSETVQQTNQQPQQGTSRTSNQGNHGRGSGRQGSTHGGRVFALIGCQMEEEPNTTLEGTILVFFCLTLELRF